MVKDHIGAATHVTAVMPRLNSVDRPQEGCAVLESLLDAVVIRHKE